jgi:very-short-patch-repair endonuclease
MIFSVGYGPAADGTISTNFGPLNKSGGERRLNVAVTRAKEKVTVVCSMQPGDVDLSGSNSVGAQHFKDYLQYAKVGERALTRQDRVEATLDFDSQFEEAVYDALESAGYDVVTQVKSSSYSIDLAIKHPEHPGSFVLGIECDGAAYHSSKTARDRDRTRQLVLENLGWDIHRIWSPDWASNKPRQLELIDERVDSLLDSDLSAAKSGDEVPEESDPTPEPSGPSRDAVVEYVPPTLQSETRYSPSAVGAEQANRNAVEDTIVENGPINYEAALRVYLGVWRESEVTENVRRAFDKGLSALRRDGVIVQDGDVLWPSAEALEFEVRANTDSAIRKIQNVPVEEVAKASTIVLNESGPMSESELRSQTADLLGYENVTSWIEEHLTEGMELLEEHAMVSQPAEDEYSLDPTVDVDAALTSGVY